MLCPYCHHPLEPLIIQERKTGAYQCIHCIGSWVRFEQVTSLANGRNTSQMPLLPAQTRHLNPLSSRDQQTPYERKTSTFHLPNPEFSIPAKGVEKETQPKKRWWPWSKREGQKKESETYSDWNVCTYCGKADPGDENNCIHCNVERMRCPECNDIMLGVRREGVLVDLCVKCRGLFFEKGRLEALIERLQGLDPSTNTIKQERPSLLQQLAAFLEDTEPSPYSVERPENQGVIHTFAAAVGEGLGGSRQVLYDFLTFLGDLGTEPDPKKPQSLEIPKPWRPDD